MKGDRELCMAAVAQDGRALQWAGEEMQDDWGIISAGLQNYGYTFKYAASRIRNNKALRAKLRVFEDDWAADGELAKETIKMTIAG